MRHVNAGEQPNRQQDVHGGTGKRHDKALPARVRKKFARIARAIIHGIFARHFDVAAKRNRADAIIGLAFAEADQTLAKTDGEDLDPHAEIFGGRIVSEFMNQDHESEHNPHDKNGVKDGQKLGHKYRGYSVYPVRKWP